MKITVRNHEKDEDETYEWEDFKNLYNAEHLPHDTYTITKIEPSVQKLEELVIAMEKIKVIIESIKKEEPCP